MDRLDAAKQALAIDAASLSSGIAARYARIFPEHRDDIASSALWGAMRAASEYDPAKGKWERWTKLCVSGEIKDFIDSYWRRHCKPINQYTLDEIPDDRLADEVEPSESYEALVAHLTDKQRRLCDLVYRGDLSLADAARAIGLTGRQGKEIHRCAINKLRRRLSA